MARVCSAQSSSPLEMGKIHQDDKELTGRIKNATENQANRHHGSCQSSCGERYPKELSSLYRARGERGVQKSGSDGVGGVPHCLSFLTSHAATKPCSQCSQWNGDPEANTQEPSREMSRCC
jgi:hypothetical protein